MRDELLDHAAQTGIAADAFSTNALQINKTGKDGIWLRFRVSRDGADADETLEILIYGKDTDASWAVTDDLIGGAGQIVVNDIPASGVVIRYCKVQTDFAYIKAYYNVGGTSPDWDVEGWEVVSGPARTGNEE